MIKKLLILVPLMALLMVSCSKKFDPDLITGKWKTAQEYWVYSNNGTGYTWDEADDVTELEAQPFTWKIDGTALQIVHRGEMGQEIPKDYTLTTLSSTTLEYKDAYGKKFSFTRCSN